jgi:hypothetical protein
VARGQYEKGDFGERRLQIDQKLSTAHQKWLRPRFEMGGAYFNFPRYLAFQLNLLSHGKDKKDQSSLK